MCKWLILFFQRLPATTGSFHIGILLGIIISVCRISGEPLKDLIRAEIVYFEREGGGAVFSVGSITFCGSLWRNGFEGPISRLLHNVVRRFSA